MTKSVFRTFLIVAGVGGAFTLSAGAAFADTYTMQDYYNALQAVDNDNAAISEDQASIYDLDQEKAADDQYYQGQIYACGSVGPGQPPRDPQATQECQDAYYDEWNNVVSSIAAERDAYEMQLAFDQAQLSNDASLLAAIKIALGI